MATNPSTSTATKVVVGTGVGAVLLGLLGAFSSKKPGAPTRPLGQCGKCGR